MASAEGEGPSTYWRLHSDFEQLREKLSETATLAADWNTYGADSPNDAARALAARALGLLQAEPLCPARLLPSAEGGITISFVNGPNRAEFEVYNTGEIAAATYSAEGEPKVWELAAESGAMKATIERIRVHLAA